MTAGPSSPLLDRPATDVPELAPWGRLQRRTRVVITCSTLAIIGVAVILGVLITHDRWVTHPNAITAGSAQLWDSGQVATGTTYAEDTLISERVHAGNIELQSVRPVVMTNTAAATVRIAVCHRHPGSGFRVGTEAFSQLTDACASVTAVLNQTVNLNASDQLIALVTLHQPGALRIGGYLVKYREASRHQTQLGGAGFRWSVH